MWVVANDRIFDLLVAIPGSILDNPQPFFFLYLLLIHLSSYNGLLHCYKQTNCTPFFYIYYYLDIYFSLVVNLNAISMQPEEYPLSN